MRMSFLKNLWVTYILSLKLHDYSGKRMGCCMERTYRHHFSLPMVILTLALVFSLTGCDGDGPISRWIESTKKTVTLPFDVTDVCDVEVYHYVLSSDAEKKVATQAEDISYLYSKFSGLEVSVKEREPDPGKAITSFRFNLSDGTSYEIIYYAIAVKAGRLKFPAEQLDYFTSADIGSGWYNLDDESVAASEAELPVYE